MENIIFYKFIENLRIKLNEELPGKNAQNKMAPAFRVPPDFIKKNQTPRKSAVLIIFYPKNEEVNIIFIKRIEDGKAHSGQVAFPGGKFEESDISLLNTSIRETFEEIGVKIDVNSIIGKLTPIYIPVSNYDVTPYIAFLNSEPEYIISNDEVQRVVTVNINNLLNTNNLATATLDRGSYLVEAPFYRIDDDMIWGATAMILSELNEIISK